MPQNASTKNNTQQVSPIDPKRKNCRNREASPPRPSPHKVKGPFCPGALALICSAGASPAAARPSLCERCAPEITKPSGPRTQCEPTFRACLIQTGSKLSSHLNLDGNVANQDCEGVCCVMSTGGQRQRQRQTQSLLDLKHNAPKNITERMPSRGMEDDAANLRLYFLIPVPKVFSSWISNATHQTALPNARLRRVAWRTTLPT